MWFCPSAAVHTNEGKTTLELTDSYNVSLWSVPALTLIIETEPFSVMFVFNSTST
jgi:hypothetical protein